MLCLLTCASRIIILSSHFISGTSYLHFYKEIYLIQSTFICTKNSFLSFQEKQILCVNNFKHVHYCTYLCSEMISSMARFSFLCEKCQLIIIFLDSWNDSPDATSHEMKCTTLILLCFTTIFSTINKWYQHEKKYNKKGKTCKPTLLVLARLYLFTLSP